MSSNKRDKEVAALIRRRQETLADSLGRVDNLLNQLANMQPPAQHPDQTKDLEQFQAPTNSTKRV